MKYAIAALAAVVLFSSGCATITTGGGPDQRVRISSDPRGGRIMVDGQYKGETPTSISLTRKDNHLVHIELNGFEPYEIEIKSGINLMTFGNAIIGGVIGLGVDLVSGATTSLSPNDIDAKLVATSGAHPNAPNISAPTSPQSTPRKDEFYPSGIIK